MELADIFQASDPNSRYNVLSRTMGASACIYDIQDKDVINYS